MNSKFAAILRSTLRLGTDRTTDFRRPLRVHASGYTHTRTHTYIRTPVPAEDLPEIRNVSSGDTWGAAPGSSDRRYDKSTVSLLLSSGIRTAHFPEELFPGERGNLPWGDTGEMDGQETEITPALRRRHGSNLLSLNADPPGARAVARP